MLCSIRNSLSNATWASGFALSEHSVSGLGNAYAGGAATTDDASAQFYNPAAMVELPGTRMSVALHYIAPNAQLKDEQANVTTLGGVPYSGSVDNVGESVGVPNLYYAQDVNERIKFGVGVTAPLGLATKYYEDWIGRYQAIKSWVETININPVLSYKLDDQITLDVGFSAQYMQAELTSAVDSPRSV